jgi:hypothetical protein
VTGITEHRDLHRDGPFEVLSVYEVLFIS